MKGSRKIRYYRTMRTTQEKRKYYDSIEQGVIPRSSRNPKNIPNAWDDHIPSRHRDKSWKLIRKHQYCDDKRKYICFYCEFWYTNNVRPKVGSCRPWSYDSPSSFYCGYNHEHGVRYNEWCLSFQDKRKKTKSLVETCSDILLSLINVVI
jgi:hypothetical protein